MYRRRNSPRPTAIQPSPAKMRLLLAVAACVVWTAGALQAALPGGMAAYYKLNAASGLTAVDETGKHNGTLTGSLAWVQGVDGNALQFKGGNGSPFVNCGAWQTDAPAGLSMALWVKWAGNNSLYQGLMGQRDGTMYWWIEIANDGSQLRFKTNTTPQSNLYLSTPHLTQNEWVHVAFSHDAPAKKGTIYLNSVEKLSGAWTLPSGTFSNLRVGLGVVNVADGLGTFNGVIDEAMLFQVPLSADDVKTAMRGYSDPVAVGASPANGQTDVPRDVTLSWTPAATAVAHDVYFGVRANDVESADRTNLMGVLAGQAQDANSFEPVGALEFGKTYYWRIDEVNGPPNTKVFKGQVWSFTVEPYAYPIKGVTATASSSQTGMGPEKTIDGSGLTADQHGTEATTMWLSSGAQPNWIQYQFDRAYKLHELWVWNSNQLIESFFGLGAKKVTIEYSTDGTTWTKLENVPEFAKAPGTAAYAPNTTVNLGGVTAQYVKLTIDSTWGGMGAAGLSEVRFFYVPVQARWPQPVTAATGIGLETDLSWRPGREAASHKVYFGTDPNAVANGTVPARTVADPSGTAEALNFGTTYYWRVDEVNAVTYPGDVWSFTTKEYAVVEDFESYNDKDNRIYDTWIDGMTNGNSGSVVGHLEAPFAEQTILHGGWQSMPLEYNNVNTPFYSEAERTFDTLQDWTANGADSLSLWVRGFPAPYVEEAGVITMSGSGHDIWDNADDFRFAYKSLTGNGSIVVKVESLTNTNAWAKAGLMIRQSLDADSKSVYAIVSYSSGMSMGWRSLAAGTCGSATQTGVAAPQWVKLTRTGDAFTAQYSADGKTWLDLKNADGTIATTTVTLTGSVYVGLCVTSHNAAATTVAVMSGAATTGNVTGPWQVAAIGDDPETANSPADLYVTVEDSAGKTATATNSKVVTSASWTQWKIPLNSFPGVNMSKVKKLYIGVGNRANPTKGGAGMLYIDDILAGHPVK
ncbi:MAG: discoidin domain-containing protein [Phycisphaerae bacterium]|nr:discoidin domain-containing protein [Phycisphaerae bacterium]